MVKLNNVIAVFCAIIYTVNCACPTKSPNDGGSTNSVPQTTPPPITFPPPPPATTIAQWISVGNLRVSDPDQVRAFLTASCSRTPAQIALVETVKANIRARFAALGIRVVSISEPAPIYGLPCPSAVKREVNDSDETIIYDSELDFCGNTFEYSSKIYASSESALQAIMSEFDEHVLKECQKL